MGDLMLQVNLCNKVLPVILSKLVVVQNLNAITQVCLILFLIFSTIEPLNNQITRLKFLPVDESDDQINYVPPRKLREKE